MFLKVLAATAVTLEDANNFRSFKVVVGWPQADLETVRRALSGIAALPDRDTAWVSEQALRSWPEVTRDAAWQDALTTMIAKARPHGWIDDVNKTIKAHVEWTA
jgi:predicted transcriptional regulator